jgi:hypothetical protein
MGTDPFREATQMSDERRASLRERGLKLAEMAKAKREGF